METDVTIRINHVGGLWVAQLPTPYGRMELLCGEGDAPDVRTIALIERFFEGPEDPSPTSGGPCTLCPAFGVQSALRSTTAISSVCSSDTA